MTEWKAQIGYKYNPSYHAYAYGLVYQPGPEQNHGNPLGCWSDAGVSDLGNYNPGVTPAYYATTARAREDSPPDSPEQHAASGHHHYPGSGVLYLSDSQAGRLLLARPHRTEYDDARTDLGGQMGSSDSTSDSEAHTSPDSWSSSSGEGNLPQTDPATWTKKEHSSEPNNRSPTINRVVSSTVIEEPHDFVPSNEGSTDLVTLLPMTAPVKPSPPPASKPKAKVRSAFSESQMNTLVQRFRAQRYLTPAEMKNLGELTGLTYQQVKTWFQNRRVKLRRHQKDSSWVSERYAFNRDGPVHGPMYANIPTHMQPYRVEAQPQPQLKEHYNQHMMKPAPQNLAFYLTTMGGPAASPGYPTWTSTAPPQAAMPARPQASSWSMPPAVNHFEFSPNAFNASATNTCEDTSFENKSEAPVNS